MELIKKHFKTVIRFIISGGLATMANLGLLFLLYELGGVHYLPASALAFIAAFLVSFSLHKFWTFKDKTKDRFYTQMLLAFSSAVLLLLVNTIGIFILAGVLSVYVVLAQAIMAVFIAVINFTYYKLFVFRSLKHGLAEGQRGNILIASGIFPPDIGGPATYVSTLLEELPKRGHKVKVVTYADDMAETENVYKVSRRHSKPMRYFLYFKEIWKKLRWADIVYIQGTVSEGLPASLACKIRSRAYVVKVVGDYAWEQGRQRFGVKDSIDDFQDRRYNQVVELFRSIQLSVVRGAYRVITPSNYLKNIINSWGVPKMKIAVVYNAVKPIVLPEAGNRVISGLDIGGDYIISVGRLVPWKGFDTLIDLMADIRKLKPGLKLVIVGDGPDRSKLEKSVIDLGLEDIVKFTGALEQKYLWSLISSSWAFILNTGYEGLPHIVVEAMRIGAAVLISRVGGNSEVVTDGENGLLFEYDNKDSIKATIKRIIDKEEFRKSLAAKAANMKTRFLKEQMIQETDNVLSSLL